MKNIVIPILVVLTILQSCTPTSNKFIADKTAKEIFNPAELKGIEKMISFVDSEIYDNTNTTDINQNYHTYFDKFKSYVANGKMFPALVKDTTKFKFLETIDKEVFAAIWRMDDYMKMVKYKDTTLTDLYGFKTLQLNYQGKYLNYLKEIGKSDKRYAEIYKNIEIAGDICPATFEWFPAHHQEFDFTSFKDRLWATVFLLRMGDPLEEKVERYLKE